MTASLDLGMPVEQFLRDYWQKKPLLIRKALADFEAPLTPNDLAYLSTRDDALARLIQHDPQHRRFQVETGPFAETVFAELPARDWTLLVQDVDKHDPDVAAILRAFRFLPSWRLDDVMVSFAVPGGSVGAHVDQYDVFLLQGLGYRRWQWDASHAPDVAMRRDQPLKLLENFRPDHDEILEPGDVLYLPPGVPHHGVALEDCLTLSIGLRAPSAAELLGSYVQDQLEQQPDTVRYADPDLSAAPQVGEIDLAAADRAVLAMRAALPALDSAAVLPWLAQFLSQYRSTALVAPARKPTLASVQRRFAQGACLQRAPAARLLWHREGSSARLYAEDATVGISVALATWLCADEWIGAKKFEQLRTPDQQAVIDLLGLGAVRWVK